MKRNARIGLTLFLMLLIPAALLTAQEKKNEQKIKIVVADKDGSNVIIDTLIKGGTMADSIRLKNGEVIYLAKHSSGEKIIQREGDNGETFVTVVSDNKGNKKTEKSITVIAGDSTRIIEGGKGSDVIIIKDGKQITSGKGGKVVTWSSSSSSSSSSTSKSGTTVEKTKYVIAKDGMVVTIEGNDEAKAKELVNEIQAKLGVNKEDKTTKKVVKEESKKINKK